MSPGVVSYALPVIRGDFSNAHDSAAIPAPYATRPIQRTRETLTGSRHHDAARHKVGANGKGGNGLRFAPWHLTSSGHVPLSRLTSKATPARVPVRDCVNMADFKARVCYTRPLQGLQGVMRAQWPRHDTATPVKATDKGERSGTRRSSLVPSKRGRDGKERVLPSPTVLRPFAWTFQR